MTRAPASLYWLMQPYAENIQTFAAMFEGYAAAADRFQQAARTSDAVATFIPLFEALNWAVALDERTGKHWTPEGKPLGWDWREKISGAEMMWGVRFIRNSVHHDWSDALELHKGGVVPPLTPPVVFFEWCWRAVDELPERDMKADDGEKVYREMVEGKPARHTLDALGRVFYFLRQVLEPSSLPRATAPTVGMLIASDSLTDSMYGER
jgi:hypothetical protein